MKNLVQVEASSREKHNYGLTAKQWKIYYKLVSISNFNAKNVEDHRYIYKNSFKKAPLCDEIGVGSVTTFNSALQKFKKLGLLVECKDYYLLYVENYVEVKLDVLLPLLDWAKVKESEIDLLRTFLVLKHMDELNDFGNNKSFTACDMLKILGHGTHRKENYQQIRYYLALLSNWGLISLKTHTKHGNNKKPYTVYHLQWIKEIDLSPDFYVDV